MPFRLSCAAMAERHLGPVADRRHGFGDEGALAALLREAGFRDVQGADGLAQQPLEAGRGLGG